MFFSFLTPPNVNILISKTFWKNSKSKKDTPKSKNQGNLPLIIFFSFLTHDHFDSKNISKNQKPKKDPQIQKTPKSGTYPSDQFSSYFWPPKMWLFHDDGDEGEDEDEDV